MIASAASGKRRALTMGRSLALAAALFLARTDAFYLPGVAPKEYADGDKVEVKVNKLSSTKTQVWATAGAAAPPRADPSSVARRAGALARPQSFGVPRLTRLPPRASQLPYDYYSLPLCKPDEVQNAVENLGEVLHGSVIQNSAYDIKMSNTDFKVAPPPSHRRPPTRRAPLAGRGSDTRGRPGGCRCCASRS